MKSILDKSFQYKNAAETNLKATFARVRREQQKPVVPTVAQNVRPIVRVKK